MGDKPASTGKQQATQFKAGQSGNPAGRTKGSRNKLGEDFIRALSKDFTENGDKAIIDCREKDVVAYCRMVAKILPKEINVKLDDPLAEYSDEEIFALAKLARSLVGSGSGRGQAAGENKSGVVH